MEPPEHVVISGRRGLGDARDDRNASKNSFRFRGAEVFHTAEDGCVRVEVKANGELNLTTFREHVRSSAATLAGTNLLQSE